MEPFKPIQGITGQLSPIQSFNEITSKIGSSSTSGEKQVSFADIMSSQLNSVNSVLMDSVESKDQLVRGELQNTHDSAIAGLKAGIMLRLTTSTLSKVSSACTTLFQMQI